MKSERYSSTLSLETWDLGLQKSSITQSNGNVKTLKQGDSELSRHGSHKFSLLRNWSGRKAFSRSKNNGNSGKKVNYSIFSMPVQSMVRIFCERVREGVHWTDIHIHQQTCAGEATLQVLELLEVSQEERNWYALYDVVGEIKKENLGDDEELVNENGGSQSHSTFIECYAHRMGNEELLLQMLLFWEPDTGVHRRRLEVRPAHPVVQQERSLDLQSKNGEAEMECQANLLNDRVCGGPFTPLGPFLLLLRGHDVHNDRMIYELKQENHLGSEQNCQVKLYFPNCPDQVCTILAEYEDTSEDALYKMVLHPCEPQQIPISVNGSIINNAVILEPGDVLAIEQSDYLFLFKNNAQTLERFTRAPQLKDENDGASSPRDTSSNKEYKILEKSMKPIPPPLSDLFTSPNFSDDASPVSLPVLRELIHETIRLVANDEIPCRVTCVLLILFMEYCNYHHGTEGVTQLQHAVSMKMTELNDKFMESFDGIRAQPLARLAMTLFDIRNSYHQMANVASGGTHGAASIHWLESSDYFENRTELLIQDILNGIIDKSSLLNSSRAILIEDPFHLNSTANIEENSVTNAAFLLQLERVLHSLRSVTATNVEFVVHHCMFLLLVTISKCLLLHIITDNELLRWYCGIRMRSNLDRLNEWLKTQQLKELDLSLQFMSAVVDVLAMPKRKLMSLSWSELRHLFPIVHPIVLNHILQFYENSSALLSQIWKPPLEEVRELGHPASKFVDSHYQDVIHKKRLFGKDKSSIVDIRGVTREPVFNAATQKLTLFMKRRSFTQDIRHLFQDAISLISQIQSGQLSPREILATSPSASSTIRKYQQRLHSSASRPSFLKKNLKPFEIHGVQEPELQTSDNPLIQSFINKHVVLSNPNSTSGSPTLSKKYMDNGGKSYSKQLAALTRLSKNIRELQMSSSRQPMMAVSLDALHEINESHPLQSRKLSLLKKNVQSYSSNHSITQTPHQVERPAPKQVPPSQDKKLKPPQPPSDFPSSKLPPRLLTDDHSDVDAEIHSDRVSTLSISDDTRWSTSSGNSHPGENKSIRMSASHIPLPKKGMPLPWRENEQSLSVLTDDDELETSFVEVILRKESGSLGLGLCDGLEMPFQRRGVYIKTVKDNSPASKCGLLTVGDQVIAVNRRDLTGESHSSAIQVLKNAGNVVRLRVKKGDEFIKMHFGAPMESIIVTDERFFANSSVTD